MSDKLVRATFDSPNRCVRNDRITGEQCEYAAVPGQEYCSKHMNCIQHIQKKQSIARYKLAIYQDQIDDQLSRSDIKSLSDELLLVRLCTQSILDLCNIDIEFQRFSPQLTMLLNLTVDIATTVHKIQVATANLLDKGLLLDLAETIIDRLQAPKGPLTDQQAIDLTDKVMTIISFKMGAGAKVQPPISSDLMTKPHYRIKMWDLHLKAYYQNPNLTSLRGELSLARVMLQEILNTVKSPASLIHELSRVVSALALIRRMAYAIQVIDLQTGNLLDRSDVQTVAAQIAEEVAALLTPAELEPILGDLAIVFGKITQPQQVLPVSYDPDKPNQASSAMIDARARQLDLIDQDFENDDESNQDYPAPVPVAPPVAAIA